MIKPSLKYYPGQNTIPVCRSKLGAITLCTIHQRNSFFLFLLKVLNNDVKSHDTIRNIIALLPDDINKCSKPVPDAFFFF